MGKDEEKQQIALDLSGSNIETIEVFVNESDDPKIFEDILRKNDDREEVIQLLYKHPNTPHDVRTLAASALNLPVPTEEDLALMRRRAAEQKARSMQKERIVKKIAKMSVAEKVKLAIKGNGEVRGILIKDSNKLVILSVLDNARITDSEILNMMKNPSTMEDAVRVVVKNKEWMKNYSILHATCLHPKTPPSLAMRFLTRLKKKDIKLLEKNKNVSEGVRIMAKKLAKGVKES